MKRSLLIGFILLCGFIVNAQKHIAVPVKIKGFSTINQLLNTRKPDGAAACDTLKLDSAFDENNPWDPDVYSITDNNTGFAFGVSNADTLGAAIKEDANFYDVTRSDYTYITGGIAIFGYANSTNNADLNKNLYFKVYDDLDGSPNQLLGVTPVTLKTVQQNIAIVDGFYLYAAEFLFSSPVAIPSNKRFYVSIDHENFQWNSSVRDSIGILANSPDQAPAAAYQYADVPGLGSFWYPVNEQWSDTSGNPLDVNLFLFPYVNNSINGCTTLPVSILDFKGSFVNNQPVLTWSTATEFNDKGFAIERSRDGKTFTQIGFVNGAGTTTQRKNYTYTDVSLSDLGAPTNYYRLKQIDLDGKTSYSNVIPLSLNSIVDWRVYPNPVKDKLTIELNLSADVKVSVQVISKDGRLLLNADKGTLHQGQQQININTQNIASGSYFVRVKAGDKYYTQTIVKQ